MSEATLELTGKQIYSVLPKVMADIGTIAKAKNNTQQGYKFRGIDDALNAINPALIKNDVTLTVNVLEHRLEDTPTGEADRNGKINPKQRMVRCVLKLQLRFMASDGSFVENVTVGEALDYNGDKATNKAMSVAAKYAFFLGLCIPVAEKVLDDSDHDPKVPPESAGGQQSGRASNGTHRRQGTQQRRENQTNGQRSANGSGENVKPKAKVWEEKIVASSSPAQLRAMKNGIAKATDLTDEEKSRLQTMAENAAVRLETAKEVAGAPGG